MCVHRSYKATLDFPRGLTACLRLYRAQKIYLDLMVVSPKLLTQKLSHTDDLIFLWGALHLSLIEQQQPDTRAIYSPHTRHQIE